MSEVTICNLALSHLGDTATVASIKPPDGSAQAQHCARFYYVARNAALELAAWGFATRRVVLAKLQPGPNEGFALDANGCMVGPWRQMYALPNAVINVLAVQSKCAPDDYQAGYGPMPGEHFAPFPQGYMPPSGVAEDVPQPFAIETLASGTQIVLTNVCDAVMRYTTLVEDTSKFSPLFVLALSHLLASMLAGPILKGDAGTAEAEKQLQLFNVFKGQASASDANQGKTNVTPAVSWIRGR